MSRSRRQLLQAAAGAMTMCLTEASPFAGLPALGAEQVPERLRFGPELEPLVRLIEETPREECVRVFVAELRRGLPYRQFLAASLFAGMRRQNSHHEVYKIHSLHQVSMECRPEERLLPLFWGLIGYKQRQEDFPLPSMTEWRGTPPPVEKAGDELRAALENSDRDRAEAAVVALSRGLGAHAAVEQLWPYGCRNGSAGGHMAIALANSFRALKTIGWQEGETGLRFVVQDWFSLGYVKPDAYLQPNQARVTEHLDHLPPGWAGGTSDRAATLELLAALREGKGEASAALALQQLKRGVSAQALWDAIHLATAELLVRHKDGWGLASRPLHSNTSTNALHYAFRTSVQPSSRLLVLLQGVAWTADKTGGDLAGQGLRERWITDLPAEKLPGSTENTVTEIFAQLPERTYRWDREKGAVLTYGKRADADEACRKAFALLHERPEAVPLFTQAAHGWLCRKASNDTHEYKFLAAMMENARWVSPEWRPHLLAAGVHYFHGAQTPDNAITQQARELLKG